jgi:UDP-N-acetylmuramoyl-tripeptide--D-alanyl-D-alanine ligase
MTADETRQAVRGRWLSRSEPVPIRGVTIDSRQAKEGDLFVAIRGENHDGHEYLQQAAQSRCVAAVIDIKHPMQPVLMRQFPAGVIGVPDTRAALLDLAAYYRSVIPATVVGVTGSNGKTTVKRMVDHILRTRLVGTASPKSFNNEIGVPLTLLSAGAGDDYVVCEVGSSGPGEIARLTRAVKPNIAVITSISEAHIERLKSVEHIAVEKAALLGWLGERDIGIVNADSPALEHALKSYEKRLIRFGTGPEAQLRVTDYTCDGRRQEFQINDRERVTLPIPGRHNALNALAAIAVAARFGFTQEDAAAALADFSGVEQRLEWIDAAGIAIINDAYNANPRSMQAAVDVLADVRGGRRVLIAGDMLELGDKAEQLHADVGRAIGSRRVDLVVGIGELGKVLAEGAARIGKDTATFANVAKAADAVGDLLQKGDTVLIKASRGMQLEKLLPRLKQAGERLAGKD